MSLNDWLEDRKPASPWGAAHRLFGGPPPADSDALDIVGWVRSILGLITMIVLGSGDRGVFGTVNEEGWGKAVTTVTISLCVLPAAVVVVYLLTEPAFRPDLKLGRLAVRVFLLLVTTFGLMAPIIVFVQQVVEKGGEPGNPLLRLLIGLAAILYMIWVGPYLLCAVLLAVRTSCFVGDYHPLLGPAVTAVVVTVATAITFIGFDTHGVEVGLWLVLTFGGLATTLGVAAAEYFLLRARHRIGWRTGPQPVR